MRGRKSLLWVIVLMVAPIVGCSSRDPDGSGGADTAPVLEIDTVEPVRRSQITETLELVGTLYPWRFATIVSEVDGIIKRLPEYEKELKYEGEGREFSMKVVLDIGHQVEQGSVLVEIDRRPFQLALDAAQAKLDVATKELLNLKAWKRPEEVRQLEAQAEEAASLLEKAELDLARSEQLRERNAVSQSEHDATQTAYRSALAAKKGADAAVELAKAGPTPEEIEVANAQLELAKTELALRQDELDKCTIYSPYDAVIADRYVGVGDRVTAMPRMEIMQIIDPSILLAQVNVPEKYQRLVKVNDLATVQAPGISQPVPGLVALVNEKIDPETRTFRVRVGVENPKLDPKSGSSERIFKSGSYVRVTLSLKSASDALVVSAKAMTFEEGQPAVFVFRGDHVEKRPVTLGISSRTEYEIKDGLSEGEEVVVGSTSLLADGLPVRLKGSGGAPAEVTQGGLRAGGEGAEPRETGLSLAAEKAGAEP